MVFLATLSCGLSAAAGWWPEQQTGLQTTTFNQQWLDVVVSIEIADASGVARPVGTGFLVRTARQHVLIVTAKHLIEGYVPANNQRLGYRLNTTDNKSVVIWDDELVKQGLGSWYRSPTSDLACRFIAWPEGVKFVSLVPDNFFGNDTLTAGAPVLVLGFPLGLQSSDHQRPIARHGIVARADVDGIIADVFVFPGNSGSPVIYSPILRMGQGLNSPLVNEERLVGVISSFIPYQEQAVSPQTQRVRVVFEENSGLANVVPVARLSELIDSEAVSKMDASIK